MKTRILSIAAAAALALGALAAGPGSASAAVTPAGVAAPAATEAGNQVTQVRDRGDRNRHHYRGKHRYGGKHHWRGRHWYGRSHWRPYVPYRSCWRTYRVHTPWGYVSKRVWVCR